MSPSTHSPRPRERATEDGATYLAHVVSGLIPVARRELADRLPGAAIVRTVEGIDERTDLIVLRGDFSARELLSLRTVEDVFVLAADAENISTRRAGLAAVRSTIARARSLDRAVDFALALRPRRKGKISFRVIARLSGEHGFRRVDLGRSAELAVLDRFPAWRLVEDDAQLELWVQLIRSSLIAGLRLSDNTMRQRTYRKVSLPAALKPTIAAAMVLLSDPRDEDVFLDPMCGSGSILIERALAGRYRLLIGSDAHPEAVRATHENIGPRYKPIEIHRWDARSLPLEDASASAIVTNLPFGKQIGTPTENRTLYPALLDEWSRVLHPGGTMVLLTSEQVLLRRSLQRHPHLHLRGQLPVIVRGQRATISVIHSLEEASQAR